MHNNSNSEIQHPLPNINKGGGISKAEIIENYPNINLKALYKIDPEYHGPTEFQVFKAVDNDGLFPYKDNPNNCWNMAGKNLNGIDVSLKVRYKDNADNPVLKDITNFVAKHPYPHEKAPLEHGDNYDTDLLNYQNRVYQELTFHIERALEMAEQHPEYGTPVFPLAFNGAKPVGHLLANRFHIPQAQMFTSQVKRVPLQDKSLVIAAGGLEFPEAVKQEQPIFPIFLDDCLATWSTQKYLAELLQSAGAKINAQYYGAVVGTRHPFAKDIITATIPTHVSISTPCYQLGDNAYLLNPDGTMQVGDMGKIINTPIEGNTNAHQQWGSGTKAHLYYQ